MFEGLGVEFGMLFDVLLAALLGLLVGLERKGGPRGAGSRTFSLICMGSALFTVLSIHGFSGSDTPERLAAQIVTGIGFIGAGVIWRERRDIIHGITTAAGIWVAAGIGISVALGFYLLAVVSAFVTMLVLSKGHPIHEAKDNLALLVRCGKPK
jgi:putative Mg2+ transporter-C (MgtC) family protein